MNEFMAYVGAPGLGLPGLAVSRTRAGTLLGSLVDAGWVTRRRGLSRGLGRGRGRDPDSHGLSPGLSTWLREAPRERVRSALGVRDEDSAERQGTPVAEAKPFRARGRSLSRTLRDFHASLRARSSTESTAGDVLDSARRSFGRVLARELDHAIVRADLRHRRGHDQPALELGRRGARRHGGPAYPAERIPPGGRRRRASGERRASGSADLRDRLARALDPTAVGEEGVDLAVVVERTHGDTGGT